MNTSNANMIYRFDEIVGADNEKHILIGEQALYRCGLTTLILPVLQCSSGYLNSNGLSSPVVRWYFNPMYNQYFDTNPSPACPNILEPSQERALMESMVYHDYFDEGILIEAIKTYGFQHDNDWGKIYDLFKMKKFSTDIPDYWINEALNDYEV